MRTKLESRRTRINENNFPKYGFSFDLRVESKGAFIARLLWVCFTTALWLVDDTRATFSTNDRQNRSWLDRMRFPALSAGYMYLLLASNFDWLIAALLWLGRVSTLVWVLQIVFLSPPHTWGKSWAKCFARQIAQPFPLVCGEVLVRILPREAKSQISNMLDSWDFASRGEIPTKTSPHTRGNGWAICLARHFAQLFPHVCGGLKVQQRELRHRMGVPQYSYLSMREP